MQRTFILLLLLLSSAIAAEAQQRNARITAILPSFGVPGTTVTIRGAGFMGFESGSWISNSASDPAPGAVEFNGVPGEIVFWQDDLITVKVPGGASTGPVRVINPGAKVAVTGASFEVPYSETGGSRGGSSAETSRGSRTEPATGESDGSAEGFLRRGADFTRRRDYRSAITQYDRAIAASGGNSAVALEGLGFAYSRLGMYDEAISATSRILTIEPQNGRAYTHLCWYYSLSDQHQAAADAGRMAVKYAPTDFASHTNLCRAYNDLGRYQDAVATCMRALELKPGDGETNYYLGRAYEGLKQSSKSPALFQKAVAGLLQYISENPDDADGDYLLANAYTATKQDDLAVRAYLKALELKPRFPQARYNLGVILFIMGRTRESLDQQEQLKSMDSARAARLLQLIKGR
ncbi:MAG TPA: tetratricopeptide repeat protein [Blastocatellia bacterium]|nr:tetratricopeptide repeat protein [Blastocatellia bacterium]